ncbi:hypothetical protein ACH5RR_008136 [Cinchona calisaya]|uniref:PB1-like domain-containing protein n=1 Tax=Cinchona calisaya TaxID=153742 RepID=A0ABD3AC97_9GENT
MRYFHSDKCKNNEYVIGELMVWDEVEGSGISTFELNRIFEVGVYGHKRCYILVEEYGFRELVLDRELNEYCTESLQYNRLLELYIKTSFKKIRQLEIGSNFEIERSNDDDYNMDEDEDNGSAGSEFSGKYSGYET